jgi:cytidine deaminase
MQQKKITITYNEYSVDELSAWQENLIVKSVEAQATSYSPYSHFKVGAAILLEDDLIVLGSNQENAAYPSGLCAERVAIFSCGVIHPAKKIKAIAISANTDKFDLNELLAPCGACRQSMLEYEYKQGEEIKVLLKGVGSQVVEFVSVKDLLPIPFNCDALQNVS